MCPYCQVESARMWSAQYGAMNIGGIRPWLAVSERLPHTASLGKVQSDAGCPFASDALAAI